MQFVQYFNYQSGVSVFMFWVAQYINVLVKHNSVLQCVVVVYGHTLRPNRFTQWNVVYTYRIFLTARVVPARTERLPKTRHILFIATVLPLLSLPHFAAN